MVLNHYILSLVLVFGLSPIATAGRPDPSPTRPDLKHTLQTWQRKLGLTDWTVGIQVVDGHALGGKAMGDIQWNLSGKRASIRVLCDQDYDLPAEMVHLDQQATILHELIHLLHASKHDSQGTDEASVVQQTNELLRIHRQWRILAVQEEQ
jgi:hypothetical protein